MIARPAFVLIGLALASIADAAPPASDLARQIRSAALDPAECYRVRDLSLAKEDLKLYFNEGYLIFSKPVNGERVSAVFSAAVEGGDGEVLLLPPYRGERASLARFTPSPNLDEHLRAAVLVFSDGSAQTLLDGIARGGGRKASEMGPLLAEQWNPSLANIESGFQLRLVQDLLTPSVGRAGLLFGALVGKTLGDFDAFYDSRNENQITVGRQAERNGHAVYDVWASFPGRGLRSGAAKPPEPPVAEQSFQVDATLDRDLALKATVRASIAIGQTGLRTLAFEAARAMQISSARVDGQPAELLFADSTRGGQVDDSQNAPFLVIPSSELAPGSAHQIEFEEHGSVISPAGNNVYFVAARANWYPRAGEGLALYDLTFRYPKRLTLVTAGDVTEDRIDGDSRVTRRVTPAPIRVAGFNVGDYVLGDYEKTVGLADAEQASGVHVEVYANRRVEAALQPSAPPADSQDRVSRLPCSKNPPPPPLPIGPPRPAPDPLARLETVAADISSALEFYSGLFGPPALKNLTVSPIPGGFGQGFPGLVYLSTLSYLDPTQRPDAQRGERAQVFFSDLIAAHEVAHQWWGNIVLPAGYQDEWLSEALASYSSLMYLEKKRGVKPMEDVLEDFRDTLIERDAKGLTTESAGPITWGFRLESTGNPAARNDITYDKGAWVLHMLRRRMGDGPFLKMLSELRRRYDSRTVSTAQFAALVKEFAPPRAAGALAFNADSFFENWVYSTGIPALKLEYTAKGVAPAVKLSGTIEQSGVDDDFSIQAPVEIQFAKGPPRVIWVQTSNDGATFSATLTQAPLKVSIPEGRDLLAVKK